MIGYIPLSQGHVAIVDDEDYQVLVQYRWAYKQGYATRRVGRNANVRMHRIIMNAKPGERVDHIDGDTLNNTRSNLRMCSHSENMANRKKHRNGKTSRFKGVHWSKRSQCWIVSIQHEKKQYRVKGFPTEIEAAQAYNERARRLFGVFARLNDV
jgi:hypothetical protein